MSTCQRCHGRYWVPVEGTITAAIEAQQGKGRVPCPECITPGSGEAVAQGCTCPVMDNGHGKGSFEYGGQFIITQGCPLHNPSGVLSDLDRTVEQGFSVWRFTDETGRRYWVAAQRYDEAATYLLEKRSYMPFAEPGELVPDLNAGGFSHGDPEDGEAPVPCTLRDLVARSLSPGRTTPVLVVEDNW